MAAQVQFSLNGKPVSVSTDARRSLLDVLREDLHLTGTKYGCGEGACRACTVLLDGKAVPSCLTTMDEVGGHKIETIESLDGNAKLHPVQEAFLQEEAMQCGYCVPGMVMRTVALLRSNPAPNRNEIIEAMNGNICRCCGYVNLINAVERAGKISKV